MCAMDLNTEEIIHKEENVEGLYGKCIDVVDDGKTLLHIGSNKIRVYQIDGPNIVSFAFSCFLIEIYLFACCVL